MKRLTALNHPLPQAGMGVAARALAVAGLPDQRFSAAGCPTRNRLPLGYRGPKQLKHEDGQPTGESVRT